MLLRSYEPHELRFAYCYRVYFRWQTFRRRRYAPLAKLTKRQLNDLVQGHQIRVLELTCRDSDLLVIVSLLPHETISACASKLKGRISKWLREKLELTNRTKLLSRSYFACTVGNSKAKVIERYLDKQAEHHGYAGRVLPPVFVKQYNLTQRSEALLAPKHARVIARFHIVLSTQKRLGIIGSQEALRITSEWRKAQTNLRTVIEKVSFVPDHVHVALRTHPACSPANIIAALMNLAQEVMQNSLIAAGLDRLWEFSVYLGAYGDLASPQLRRYLENFRFD
ncbi:MAG TPA: transposase [Pyrinomonadaceae bacterium]